MDALNLDEIVGRLSAMPEDEKQQVIESALQATSSMRGFVPLPGPQTEAYLSDADILLYGGQAGGGKSYLLMGLASQEHRRGIVFRRETAQTDGLQEAGKAIIGADARFNGQDLEWNWPDGRNLKLGGIKEPGDWNKYAGRERDFMGFDEAGEFLREQVASLIAWLRAAKEQRCRVVLASNPPRSSDGYWVMEWFAPWLDPQSSDKAAYGELRWAVLDSSGSPQWVNGPDDCEGDARPLSFTFIPAALSDNPHRNTPEYRARLNSLPEPLRSQLLFGDFTAGQIDAANQVMPTDWVKAAQQRWTPTPPEGVPMCALGVDVAQGGADQTVISSRHDGWFAPLLVVPGEQTPGGPDVAGLVIAKRQNGAQVVIDIGGGWGGDAYAHLAANDVDAVSFMGVKASTARTRDKQLAFRNVRSEAWWRFREALDPSQPAGSPIMLPDDRELAADLTAPTFEVGPHGIQVEPKDKLVKRLGRSPDRGDAVVMAWFSGAKMETHYQQWKRDMGGFNRSTPQVVVGHAAAKRRRR